MQYWHLVVPPTGRFANERELADHVLGRLDPHFHIEREVPGHYPGGEDVRLDAVLRPRDTSGWFDADLGFGVEFKHPEKITSFGEFGAQIAQASDYNHCTFDGHGRSIRRLAAAFGDFRVCGASRQTRTEPGRGVIRRQHRRAGAAGEEEREGAGGEQDQGLQGRGD
ncbi:hypothetical protein [Kitasatospora sp. NPDC096204]|uniref:hypothetical protein n=1 Tax=Kitasatospora sp. NPDC096204 TaxID=3364094 RepID=UPI0038105A5C